MKTRVLHVVRRPLLLSFNLYTNLKPNGTRHCWLVCSLFCNTRNKYSVVVSQIITILYYFIYTLSVQMKGLIWRFPTQVVPDVHLSTQSSDLDDALTQEVVGLPLQALLHPWLDVIVFIPDPQLDAIWRVVALAVATGGKRSQHHPVINSFSPQQTQLTSWTSPPRLGSGCHRWSWSSSWSSPPGWWRKGRWSQFCPWPGDPERSQLEEHTKWNDWASCVTITNTYLV